MTCHLFGGVWSGSAAVYALKKCIAISDPDLVVKDTIMRSFTSMIFFDPSHQLK